MRMPAMRVLVNTPAPQGSTGITTNVFPSMTLGCGAMANNITTDNVGPQHLINIKRLAYVVRTPEEAFEMPLDINKAPYGPSAPAAAGPIDRDTVVAAVETLSGFAWDRNDGRARACRALVRMRSQTVPTARKVFGSCQCGIRRGGPVPGQARRRLPGRI